MALITCSDTAFAYDGAVAVSGLNFAVNSGDYLCVIGENGSGKSTLIRGLLGLKQPSKGHVVMGDGLKANEIGYLPQHTPVYKDFPASVYEVVLSGRLNRRGIRPFYSRADKMSATENMKLLGVQDLSSRCYRELSGGQRQRVLLARALCATKKLVLLDEPVAGLDPIARQELYKQILSLNRDSKLTVVMVSHDIQSAAEHATHILHLQNSQLFFGTCADYLKTGIGEAFMGGCCGHDGDNL